MVSTYGGLTFHGAPKNCDLQHDAFWHAGAAWNVQIQLHNSAKTGTWLIWKFPLSPSSNIFRLIKEHKREKENKEEIILPEIFRHEYRVKNGGGGGGGTVRFPPSWANANTTFLSSTPRHLPNQSFRPFLPKGLDSRVLAEEWDPPTSLAKRLRTRLHKSRTPGRPDEEIMYGGV